MIKILRFYVVINPSSKIIANLFILSFIELLPNFQE